MPLIVGIDEAGLGPRLGPLVVSAAAFRVPDDGGDACLWRRLGGAVCRADDRNERRLTIADSKKLFAGRRTLAPLERGVLVMLRAAARRADGWHDLLRVLAPECLRQLRDYVWYDGPDFALPLHDDTGDVATRANPLRRQAQCAGVEFVAFRSEVLLEGSYNQLLAATGNKAQVVLSAVLKLVDSVWRSTDDADVRITVDRLGGREHYRHPLMTAFPDLTMHVLCEEPERSGYRLEGRGRCLSIEFVVGGEDQCLATAYGSMMSKYLRELFMHAFNRYWTSLDPTLKPTAGYYVDAERFLTDLEPVLRRQNIPRRCLERAW